jgi:hypothetical protein
VSALDWVLAAGLLLSLGLAGFALRRLELLERRLPQRAAPVAGPAPPRSIQQLGLVRYQAYPDVGGDHSFALALLDAQGEGVVVNSLYHRDRCRVYAKPVSAWLSPITLTEEEAEAIRRARDGAGPVDMAALSR